MKKRVLDSDKEKEIKAALSELVQATEKKIQKRELNMRCLWCGKSIAKERLRVHMCLDCRQQNKDELLKIYE